MIKTTSSNRHLAEGMPAELVKAKSTPTGEHRSLHHRPEL
jgi:hypothetical protein